MRQELAAFFTAWQALTRGPLAAAAGQGARHYPAVGLVVGGFGAVVLWAGAHVWPATVAVGVALVAVAWLTRARHEHGLQRAAGVVGLLAVVGLKAAALHGLVVRDFTAALAVLPLAHALSRAAMAVVERRSASDSTTPAVVLVWCVIAGGLAVVYGLEPVPVLVAALAAGIAGWVLARGEASADAVQAVCEAVVLLAVLAVLSRS